MIHVIELHMQNHRKVMFRDYIDLGPNKLGTLGTLGIVLTVYRYNTHSFWTDMYVVNIR